ncbi:MAG: PD-(D/E)XK nuclease family protein [Novosphingobium sp.]|nr:PD-(D/E)XK nuclease family protein [Novosphingobium sp.]
MPLTTDKIEAFATSWRACRSRHNLACRLGAFSEETRRLLPQVRTMPTMAQGFALATPAVGRVSNELRRLIASRTNRGDGINIWNAAGLGTDERRNVAVLARLWMRSSLGDLATQFLSAFLKRVEGAENISLEGWIPCPHRVFLPMSDAAHRVDLVIETEATIIALEAKIRAPADKDQLARYDRELKERARQKGTHLLIYLGPRLLENSCAHVATWNSVAAAAREVAQSADGNTRRLLRDFADHISTFRS